MTAVNVVVFVLSCNCVCVCYHDGGVVTFIYSCIYLYFSVMHGGSNVVISVCKLYPSEHADVLFTEHPNTCELEQYVVLLRIINVNARSNCVCIINDMKTEIVNM